MRLAYRASLRLIGEQASARLIESGEGFGSLQSFKSGVKPVDRPKWLRPGAIITASA